jgi:long-chain fatty acid transport protein
MAKTGCTSEAVLVAPFVRGRAGLCVLGAATALIAASAASPQTEASAFFIREQSATALGSAYAGATAGIEDITYMFFNGAVLARQHGNQAAAVGTLELTRAKFGDGRAGTAGAIPVAGGEGGRNAGGTSLVPSLYASWDAGGSVPVLGGLVVGIAINAPFGFETEYDDGWIGRYYALQSRLRSLDVNPVVTYAPLQWLSVAIGLQAQHIDAKLSNAIDFGTLGALNGVPGAVPTAQDGFAKLTGDDWGFGYTAGVLLEPWSGTRLGAAYRSAIHHQIRGDARIRLDSAGIGAALGAGGGTTGAEANLTTPEIISLGLHQELGSGWAVMAEASWTRWSRFRMLRIKFDDPPDGRDVADEDWRDAWFLAVGCAFRPTEGWVVRSGIGYDQSPVRNRTRTPRTPANNGVLVAVGTSYRATPAIEFALGYGHYFIDKAAIDLSANAPGNTLRGSLSGSSNNAVDILSVQLRWMF